MTYITILYSLYTYSCRFPYTLIENEQCADYVIGLRANNLLAIVNVSSIFSAMRNMYPNEFAKYVYYIVYLISKIGAMIIYYHFAYENYNRITQDKCYLSIVITLHTIQLYFCWAIVKIMMKKQQKTQ